MRLPDHAVLIAIFFFLAGVLSRLTILRIETRWQIVAFCVLALLWELSAWQFQFRTPSVAGGVLNAAAAATAICIVKYTLEPHAWVALIRTLTSPFRG